MGTDKDNPAIGSLNGAGSMLRIHRGWFLKFGRSVLIREIRGQV